ncbi:hypothetical protein D3C78_1382490 [compost metagenome]
MGDPTRRREIQGKSLFPTRVAFVQCGWTSPADGINHNVYRAEALLHLSKQAVECSCIGDIRRNHVRPYATAFRDLICQGQQAIFTTGGSHHGNALRCKYPDHTRTDSFTGAGHQRDAILQLQIHKITLLNNSIWFQT